MIYAIIQMFVEFPYDPLHRLITDVAVATAMLCVGAIWVAR